MTLQDQLDALKGAPFSRLDMAYAIQEILCSEPGMTENQRYLLKAANQFIDKTVTLDDALEVNGIERG
jgi:hypothetical protein